MWARRPSKTRRWTLIWVGSGALGTEIAEDRLKSILDSLDIAVTEEQGDMDVDRSRIPQRRDPPADVAEEILRIHGFDHVPLPTRMTGR